MVSLVSSVLVTLLRRDMSLNRRLFTWLLGTEVNTSLLPDCHPVVNTNDQVSTYFTTYSLHLLIAALLRLLEGSVESAAHSLDIKPFRIITTLLDNLVKSANPALPKTPVSGGHCPVSTPPWSL